jgi:hypothetical protein
MRWAPHYYSRAIGEEPRSFGYKVGGHTNCWDHRQFGDVLSTIVAKGEQAADCLLSQSV